MKLDNTPFCIAETRHLDCQFGQHYYKEKPHKSSCTLVQGSRKKGCHAHILIKKCIAYPEYKVDSQCNATVHTLREKRMSELKAALYYREKCCHKYSLFHITSNSGHSTFSGVAGFSQNMNEKVATKIAELVAEGITEVNELHRLLRH